MMVLRLPSTECARMNGSRKCYASVQRLLRHFSSGTPPPVRVGLTENAGRGVFATREIRSGDLIHTDDPFVAHPYLSTVDKVCYYCLRRLESFASSHWGKAKSHANILQDGQNEAHFCSNQCTEKAKAFYEIEKKADWSLYHEQCREKGLKYPLLVKRLACMAISGVASADSLDILQPANFPNGISSKGEDEFELLIRTLKNGGTHPELLTFLTKEWYFSALARIRVNVFRIEMIDGTGSGYHADLLAAASASISAETAVGNAVYTLSSMYNHDCDPNTHILWIENAKARLKALRNIEAGEELRICYIDASLDHEARQSVLYQGFGFSCRCFRCKSED